MVDLEKFQRALERRPSYKHRSLFHFTEAANLPSIQKHGLLSLREIEARKMDGVKFSSNSGSRIADRRKGLDDYVHLCLFPEHPMQFSKEMAGELEETKWLNISPEVVTFEGALFCSKVSNADGAVTIPLTDLTGDDLDVEIIFKRTDWRDASVRERINLARKYEILIPKHVPSSMIVI